MPSQQQFDITSLHQAYENGVTAEDVVTEVFRRIDAVNDPGIFLHLDDQERILSEARDLVSLTLFRILFGAYLTS